MIRSIHDRMLKNFIPSLLGIGGSNSGLNFNADKANILKGSTADQAQALLPQAQRAIDQQALLAQQYFQQNPLAKQNDVFNQQQMLAHQLQGVANGVGPNPALAQLNQATGQNVNQQAALMASQRGAGANAGLLARQAAMQGGNIQQQAAGQAATMQAQQQMAGMQALQSQQGQMAGLANTQAGQLGQAVGGYNQAAQSEQQNLLNALAQYNNANVAMQSNVNSANAGIAQGQIGMQSGIMGTLGGLGAAAMLMADGGMVKKFSDGGIASGPQSFQGKFLFGTAPNLMESNFNNTLGMAKSMSNKFPKSPDGNSNNVVGGMAEGFKSGGPVVGEQLASQGKLVPGDAKVKGDNLKNDVVPAMLSPGEIVIPRSITSSKDPINNAAAFVAQVLARNGMRK